MTFFWTFRTPPAKQQKAPRDALEPRRIAKPRRVAAFGTIDMIQLTRTKTAAPRKARLRALPALIAALIALQTAPAAAQEITVSTARGEATVSMAPENVAVFDIAAIDTLTAMGVDLAGVPDKLYVPYLSGVNAPQVGTLFEPNLEALAQINPDLIVIGGRTAVQYDAVSKLAPTLDMTISQDTINDARSRIESYGALFDKQDQATEMTMRFDASLKAAQDAVAGKGNGLILMTNGPKVSAYGVGSRFGWIHSALGLPQAFDKLVPETHGDSVSFEFIAEVNPDWLIVIDRSVAVGEAASADTTLDNPLINGTTAAQKGQIVMLSPAPLYIAGGGYTAMTQSFDEIATAFTK